MPPSSMPEHCPDQPYRGPTPTLAQQMTVSPLICCPCFIGFAWLLKVWPKAYLAFAFLSIKTAFLNQKHGCSGALYIGQKAVSLLSFSHYTISNTLLFSSRVKSLWPVLKQSLSFYKLWKKVRKMRFLCLHFSLPSLISLIWPSHSFFRTKIYSISPLAFLLNVEWGRWTGVERG